MFNQIIQKGQPIIATSLKTQKIMSFNDYSAVGKRGGSNINLEIDKSERIRTSIFTISSNISSLQRFVQAIGTNRDTPELRRQLHEISSSTQELIVKSGGELKSIDSSSISRIELQKLGKDFAIVVSRFQNIQKQTAEKSREYVAKAKHVIEEEEAAEEKTGFGEEQESLLKMDQDIEYSDALINEREQGIAEIEQSIYQVNEIFRDLSTLVTEQQGMIDNIEANIESTANRTGDASFELQTAERYQKKGRNKLLCILMIFTIVITVIIIILVSKK